MVSTCREIVRTVVDYGVEKDDWKKTWKADAQVGLSLHHLPCTMMLCHDCLTLIPPATPA